MIVQSYLTRRQGLTQYVSNGCPQIPSLSQEEVTYLPAALPAQLGIHVWIERYQSLHLRNQRHRLVDAPDHHLLACLAHAALTKL